MTLPDLLHRNRCGMCGRNVAHGGAVPKIARYRASAYCRYDGACYAKTGKLTGFFWHGAFFPRCEAMRVLALARAHV